MVSFPLLSYQQVFLICLCVFAQGLPQQNNNVNTLIRDIFNTTVPRRSSGFGNIVQPAPVDPNNPQPNFESISGRSPCNCVPYHMCSVGVTTDPEEDSFDGTGVIDIRFGVDDNGPGCEHPLDVCCDVGRTREEPLMPTPPVSPVNRPTGCGIRNVRGVDFTITGNFDNEANFGEFPWTAALLHASNFSYFCAASLIHPRVVLTGYHCLNTKQPNNVLVRAGEWDTQTIKERLPYQERRVERVISHPAFHAGSLANDFALVIVTEAFNLDEHINVVCLPSANAVPAANTECFSTGWGKDVFGAEGRYSAIMKRVSLPIVNFDTCQTQFRSTRLGQKFALHRSFICAGGIRGTDTCQGDGGAPLACPIGLASDNRYQQSGIVAWGIGCNDNIPAAYANVASVRNWIDQQMLGNGFSTDSYSVV